MLADGCNQLYEKDKYDFDKTYDICYQIVTLLIQHGINKDIKDDQNKTAEDLFKDKRMAEKLGL